MRQHGGMVLLVGMLLLSPVATAQQLSPEETFARYDIDGDSFNDLDEYVLAGDDDFAAWDTDNDGLLTAVEMGAAVVLSAAGSPGGAVSSMDSAMVDIGRGLVSACDFDRNGDCTLAEYRRQIREQLFPMMDQDRDGRLSFEEAMRFRTGNALPAGS